MSNPTKATTPGQWDGADPAPSDDPSTIGSALYMLLSLATGIGYFTWAVVGLSVSISLMPVLVGIPLLLAFLVSIRLVGVVESRCLDGLLGVRTLRESGSTLDLAGGDRGFFGAFLDRRTWTTLVYMLLMLPIGIAYFAFIVVGITAPVALIGGSIGELVTGQDLVHIPIGRAEEADPMALVGVSAVGVAVLMLMRHLIRGIGLLHARFARAMLVRG